MIKRFAFLFAFCSSCLFAATPANTLVIAQKLDDLASLDPAEVFEQSGLEYLHNCYSKLVRYEPESKDPFKGELAASWEVKEEGKVFVFTLKEGILFPSGNPLSAQDVAYSFERLVALNKSPSYLLTQFGINAENRKERICALSSKKVQITLDKPYSPSLLLAVLSSENCAIVEKKLVEEQEKQGDFGNFWLKNHHAGSGSYLLERVQPGKQLVLSSNLNYFAGAPEIKKVTIIHVPEPITQRLLLEREDIDIARNLTPGDITGLEKVKISAHPIANLQHMSMNLQNPYLSNLLVRKAIRYLIDQEGLALLKKDGYQRYNAFIPIGFLGADEKFSYEFSPEKAQELLKQAGYENGFSLTLDTIDQELGAALQAMFKKGNISISVLVGDSKQVLTKMRNRNFALATSQWIPDFIDPHSNAYAYAFNSDNSSSSGEKTLAWRCNFQDKEASAQVFEAMQELDLEKRKALYLSLQRSLQDSSPYVHLFQQQRFLVQNQNSLSKKVVFLSPADIIEYSPRGNE